MQISFIQGIIRYPSSGGLQTFLVPSGAFVNLSTAGGPIDLAFSHKQSNYLLTESVSITNAWGPIPASTDTWLFWDINLQSGARTFGITFLEPLFGPTLPPSAPEGQHFFETTNKIMFLFENGNWRTVVRVFAAKINNTILTSVGGGQPGFPFAGSQVGLNSILTFVGRIVFDNVGMPIRRQDGTFFTTEDQFFVEGSPVTAIKLEANVLTATAQAPLAQFGVVKLNAFGQINYAGYNDLQNTFIAMLMENLSTSQTGTMVCQGTITNPLWDWSVAGAELWVLENGELTETDPHITDVSTYPIGKPPVARVITPTTIFFDQGLGGKGDIGPVGSVNLATNAIPGISALSLAAANPAFPITVGDNDPRMVDARVPLAHTHPATAITFSPYQTLTASDIQLVLQQVQDQKVAKAGDTMTGFLTLNADPTAALHAATKQYVDNSSNSSALSDITPATTTNIINNNDNDQVWNWSKTTDSTSGFTFSENVASTNGSGDQNLIKISTLADSTANPLTVFANGSSLAALLISYIGDILVHANNADGISATAGSTVGVIGGDATGGSKGGNITISAGAGGPTSGDGGDITIQSGIGGVGGDAGAINISSNTSLDGNSGGISIVCADAIGTDRIGGSITIQSGLGTGSGINGSVFIGIGSSFPPDLQIDENHTWLLSGDSGTSGFVLTSNGPGTAPTWQSGSAGTVTSVSIGVPSAGITQIGSPITSSGTITLALANDLSALEGLVGTGIAVRTSTDTWTLRTISGTMNRIVLSDGNGVSADPTIDISSSYVGQSSITTLGTITSGTWNGTTIGITSGGTGQVTANAAFNALAPNQVGNSGKFLTTNGTDTSWATVSSGTPAGSNTQVQFNNSGSFGADSNFTWDNSLKHLILGGGNLQLYGNAVGDIYNPNGDIRPHIAPSNSFRVFVGTPGSGTERFRVDSTGAIAFSTSFGTAGQVLTSNGSSSPPTWQAGGSGTPAGSNTQVQFNNSGSFGADTDFTWNNSTNQLYVTGSVGIGSTTLFDADTKLQLTGVGAASANMTITSTTNSAVRLNGGTDGSGISFVDILIGGVLKGNIACSSATSGVPLEINSAATTNVWMVGGGGKVGINVNPPTELLHIKTGNFRIEGTSGTHGIIFPDASTLLSAGLLLNTQSGTSYTLLLTDLGYCIEMTNGSANTLTVPPNSSVAFPIGTIITVRQNGAGQTTIVAGGGVTINTPETLKIRKQWGTVTLHKRATDEWCLEGNLEVAP